MKLRKVRMGGLLALAFALPLAAACSGESEGNGGTGGNGVPPETPLGQELAGIAQLADEFIGGENAEAYEGLDFAAAALEGLFGGSAASALVVTKQESCIPPELQNMTLEYDAPLGTYISRDIPGAPEGGVRIFIYEIDQNTPTDNNIGSLNVTCEGFLPNVAVTASLTVNGSEGPVEVLNLNASGTFGLDSYSLNVSGFLASADGTQQINYGDLGDSGGSMTSFDSNFGVTFTVGERTFATLSRFVSSTEESVFINVRRETPELFEELLFSANPFGPGEVVSGPATFVLNPPAGSGAIDIVACLEGTFESMSVLPASESCSDGFLDLIQLPQADLDAMERAYQGLQGMYAAVEGVSAAGAAIALEALAGMNQ